MDPHSFIARAEAQRWLGIAEKLLMSHDLVGSKTFAIRARDSDPRLEAAEQILAIADTLLAAEKRVTGNNGSQQPDFYAILQLVRFVQDTDHITSQYRRLAVMLNPHHNRFPYSDQAFQLVNEAWQVLSNPLRKSMYDSELDFPQQQQMGFNLEQQQQQQHHHHQQHHHQQQQQQQQHNFFSINHLGSGHERELSEPPPPPPPQQQTFQTRAQQQHQQLQQHNFLSQPKHEQLFQHREHEQLFQPKHEQLFQPQVQPFQVTSPQRRQPSQPPPQSIQSPPPPAAPPQPPFSWPQPPPLSQPQHPPTSIPQKQPPQQQPPITIQQQQPTISIQPQISIPQQQPSLSHAQQPSMSQPQSLQQPHHSQTRSQPPPPPQQQHFHQPQPESPQPQQEQEEEEEEEFVEQIPSPVHPLNEVNDNNGVREEEMERETVEAPEVEEQEEDDDSPNFWTTCPYCFYMYEYPKIYAECTLRCDNCDRAFQAVRVPSPPSIIEGQEACFYCWGFFPLGVSMSHLEKNNKSKGKSSKWTPFSSLFDVSSNVQNHLNEQAAPKENLFVNKSSGPRIYIDDITDDVFMGISEPSDDDSDGEWGSTKVKRMKKSNTRSKVLGVMAKNCISGKEGVESSKKVKPSKEFGKLDLNVEFNNNEGEMSNGNRGNEEDNIEGIGFFEGLDEFLSNLPILNDEKVKAA